MLCLSIQINLRILLHIYHQRDNQCNLIQLFILRNYHKLKLRVAQLELQQRQPICMSMQNTHKLHLLPHNTTCH